VSVADGQTNEPVGTGGGVLSYPPEYRDLKPNAALLTAMADATGGKQLANLEGVFSAKPDPVRSFWPLWEVLLVIITSALLADVAWRRLNVTDWVRRRRPAGMPVLQGAPTGAAMGAWRNIRTTRQEVETQRETLRERVDALAAQTPVAVGEASTPAGSQSATIESSPAAKPGISEGYSNRLMSAKKRAAEQIREQTDDNGQQT
jgi:hypothetical protein